MSIKAVSWALEVKMSDAIAKLVLIGIADKYNEERGFGWPSVKWLATVAGCSDRTIRRKLTDLQEQGYVAIDRRFNDTSCYRLPMLGGTDTALSGGDSLSGGDTALSGGTDTTVTGGTDTALSGGTDTRCPPNYNNNINNNNYIAPKRVNKKQKVSEWIPTPEDIAYAKELGLDADEVLTDIRLWDDKNGNKASYSNVTAFWQSWCRRDAKGRPTRSVSQQSGNQQVRSLSPAQEGYIDGLARKYYGKYAHEGYDFEDIKGYLTEYVTKRYGFEEWVAMGHGLAHMTEL